MKNPLIHKATRLMAYSDALFAIVATVMIVPIAHTEVPKDEVLRPKFVELFIAKLIVYSMTFLLACEMWSQHVRIFETIVRVDEITVLLNLALMMSITFFPYTFTLLGSFPNCTFAIVLFCSVLIFVGLIECACLYHAFRNPDMLNDDVKRRDTSLKSQRNSLLATQLTPVIFGLGAIIAATFSTVLANILLVFILFGNFFRRQAIKFYNRCIARRPELELSIEDEGTVRQQLMYKSVSKERIECFSDGVFTIVATLIILDICDDNIPTDDDVDIAGSVVKALRPFAPAFLAYAGTFVSVGQLWYVHHSLLHYITDMNLLMVVLNNLSLLSVGFIPLAFQFVSMYSEPDYLIYANETLAIQFNCLVLFMAGLHQSLVWITGLWNQTKRITPAGHYGTAEHYYMTAKLTVFPLLSLLVFCFTLANDYKLQTDAFNLMQIGALGLFILLQIVYTLYKRHQRRNTSGIAREFLLSENDGANLISDSDNDPMNEATGEIL